MFDTKKPFIDQIGEMARQFNETHPSLQDERVEGEDMAKRRATTTDPKAPLYTWAFQSSQTRVGGTRVTYVTQLNADETLSCNCPGWIFCKIPIGGTKSDKACKHTRDVISEVPQVIRVFREGGTLPTINEGSGETGFQSSIPTPAAALAENSKIRFGRVIDI